MELSLDGGGGWQSLTGTTTWSYNWDTMSVTDGTYLLLARAQDEAGNWEHTASLTVHVDNTPPEVEVNSPASVCSACNMEFEYIADDAGSGVGNWLLTVDGALVDTGFGNIHRSRSWTSLNLPLGAHTIYFRAEDLAGNVSEASTMVNLVAAPVMNEPTATRTLRPTKTLTPTATKTKSPTKTPRPSPTLVRIVSFPTVTSYPTSYPYPSDYSSFQEFEEEAKANSPLTKLQGKGVFIGIFIAAVLAAGGYLATKYILDKRTWAFEEQLANHGMGEAFWLPTPPGQEIMKGPPELATYEPEEGVRTSPYVAQYVNVRELLNDAGIAGDFYTIHNDLCGEISVAALLGISLQEALVSFSNIPAEAEDLQFGETYGKTLLTPRPADDVHPTPWTVGTNATNLIRLFNQFGWEAHKVQAGSWQTKDPRNPSSGAPSWQEIANLLNTGHGVTALVRLNASLSGDNAGALSKAGVSGVNHWVNILEIINGNTGTYVRIYNPYLNREETYRWNDFLNAWNNVPPKNGGPGAGIPNYQAVVSKPNVSQTRKLPYRYNRPSPSIAGKYMPVER